MPIGFGKPQDDDVVSLIAARKYARAIEVLKEQLRAKGANPSLRMQLADVLILADKTSEAVSLLLPLADQYATEGFAAKAVSVLKKIQRVDPSRRDVESRLARLIEEKQREASALTPSRSDADRAIDDGPGLEIGLDAIAPVSTPAEPFTPAPEPEATTQAREPLPADADATLPGDSQTVLEAVPLAEATAIEDYDLLYLDGTEEEIEASAVLEPEEGPEAAVAGPMSAGQFAEELMTLVDSVFQECPGDRKPAAATAAAGATGSQIVVSPFFRDFSVDEMVAVIQGLRLDTFERGDVILREGTRGASLYLLTSGRVRAFRKDPRTGRQNPLGDLDEGAFFGEVSILTGQPRTASVVALSRCELLELDRPTLDEITKAHPHVWAVLREFAEKRASRAR